MTKRAKKGGRHRMNPTLKRQTSKTKELEEMTHKGTMMHDVMVRFSKNKIGIVGLVIVGVLLILVIFAPLFTRYDFAEQVFTERFLYPSKDHILGTDDFGRDLWARILYGGRNSLLIAFLASLIATIIGVVIGAVAGFFGGKADTAISRILDIIQSVPQLLLAIAVSAALGSGPVNTAIAISVSAIPGPSRIMRSTVMSIKANEYVEASRALGATDIRTIFVHILPNTIAPLIINTTLGIGYNILAISGLSFIGLGVKPPVAEWGSILSVGKNYLRDFWPMTVFPALFIMLTIFGFNLLGDALRDALDPRLKD